MGVFGARCCPSSHQSDAFDSGDLLGFGDDVRFERQRNANIYALHSDLLRLRHEETVFRVQRRGGMDGAVLGFEAFVVRFFGANCDDRLLMVNLGRDLNLSPAPEPLLAAPANKYWEILWSSEDLRYGGSGIAPLEAKGYWHIPGHAAVVLKPTDRQGV